MAVITIGLGLVAGPDRGQAQGFVRHFDSEQAGKPGAILSIREVPDGFLLFVSQVSADGTNRTHLFTRIIGQSGQQVLEREYYYEVPRHYVPGPVDPIATCADGLFSAAIFDIGPGFDMGISLFRFNLDGDTIGTRSIYRPPTSDSLFLSANQIRQCIDGGYFICGSSTPYVPGASVGRSFLIRTNSVGDTLWKMLHILDPLASYRGLGVTEYIDGGAIVTGYRYRSFVLDEYFVMRTDALGAMQWIRYFGNRAKATDAAVRLDSDDNIITYSAYKEPSFPTLHGQFMLTKWSADGDIIWQKKSHYGRNYYVGDFEVLPDNSIIAVGSHDGGGELMRFSAEGDSLWTRQYVAFVSSERHRLFDVQPTSDGGFVAAGSCDQYWGDPTPNLETEWMIKTDSMGCVVPGCQNVGVQEVVVDLQEHLRIAPNPVSDMLQAELELPAGATLRGAVRAVLLNAQGRQVQAWPVQRSGEMLLLRESIGSLPSGAYYLHIADEKRWLAGGKVVVE